MKELDQEKWNRKEHFDFFSSFDEPFFGIVSEVVCTHAFDKAKSGNYSFFASYLHKSLLAANAVEELKYRIEGSRIIICDQIHASATLGREDGTFGFSFIPYKEDFEAFLYALNMEIDSVKNSAGIRLNDDTMRRDIIHYSSFPWYSFTGLTHARNFNSDDSCPKITFGKTFQREHEMILPLSINAHHGLADGIHISRFLDLFQDLLTT